MLALHFLRKQRLYNYHPWQTWSNCFSWIEKGEEVALSTHERISFQSRSLKWERKDNLHLLTVLFRLSLGEKLLQAESDCIYKMDKITHFEFRCTNACGHGCDTIWHNGSKLCFEIWEIVMTMRQLYFCLPPYSKKDQKHQSEIQLSLNVWLHYIEHI